ncbi:MAG: hypothetical protein ACOCWL_02905 [Thermoguttaceae bacterium]
MGALLSGCGGDNPLNRQAVSGNVTLDGAPLERGVIEFHAQRERGVASGALIQNGSYSLPREKGLPEGSYLVRIYSGKEHVPDMQGRDDGELPGPASELPAVELIPPRYNAFSDIVREVSAETSNEFDFDVVTSNP